MYIHSSIEIGMTKTSKIVINFNMSIGFLLEVIETGKSTSLLSSK